MLSREAERRKRMSSGWLRGAPPYGDCGFGGGAAVERRRGGSSRPVQERKKDRSGGREGKCRSMGTENQQPRVGGGENKSEGGDLKVRREWLWKG